MKKMVLYFWNGEKFEGEIGKMNRYKRSVHTKKPVLKRRNKKRFIIPVRDYITSRVNGEKVLYTLPTDLLTLPQAYEIINMGITYHYEWTKEFSNRIEEKRERYERGERNEERVYKALKTLFLNFDNWAAFKMGRKSEPDADMGMDILILCPNGGLGIQVKSSPTGIDRFEEKELEFKDCILTICVNENTNQKALESSLLQFFNYYLPIISKETRRRKKNKDLVKPSSFSSEEGEPMSSNLNSVAS